MKVRGSEGSIRQLHESTFILPLLPCEGRSNPKLGRLSLDQDVLRSLPRLRRWRQHSVEVLAVVVALQRLHKDLCNVASCRSTRGLEKI